ncbi:MAG: hypothetical protein RO257_14530 [Candidatus Kapabacteria bacterium]|nr:hypothetical protein [Candidatus Kapabacteria bacterium]
MLEKKISPELYFREGYEIIGDFVKEIDGEVIILIGQDLQIAAEFDAISVTEYILEGSDPIFDPNPSFEFRLAESLIYSLAWSSGDTFNYCDYSAEFVINLVDSIFNLQYMEKYWKYKFIGLLSKQKIHELKSELEPLSTKVDKIKVCKKYF